MSEQQNPLPPTMIQHPGSVVASSLAGQLGSDPRDLAELRVDMRRFSVLEEKDMLSILYGIIRSRKSPTWKKLIEEYLNLKVSIGGRGRRDIINMEKASHGGMADVSSELDAIRPGWLGRNITNRDWREEAVKEGKA